MHEDNSVPVFCFSLSAGWSEDLDVESLDSLSDDDSSLDDDFFIVKLPDCFDTSKPIVYTPAPRRDASAILSEFLAQQNTAGIESLHSQSCQFVICLCVSVFRGQLDLA